MKTFWSMSATCSHKVQKEIFFLFFSNFSSRRVKFSLDKTSKYFAQSPKKIYDHLSFYEKKSPPKCFCEHLNGIFDHNAKKLLKVQNNLESLLYISY